MPSRSVSAAEPVVSSGKVVVARLPQPGADNVDPRVRGHLADDMEPGSFDDLARADADELRLFPTVSASSREAFSARGTSSARSTQPAPDTAANFSISPTR